MQYEYSPHPTEVFVVRHETSARNAPDCPTHHHLHCGGLADLQSPRRYRTIQFTSSLSHAYDEFSKRNEPILLYLSAA